ncbi:uncharacterized protein LOC135331068 [Halichondria panicea]|uniref:uncharacterized protein LOC135331068 n=1 Tax=Halichondria panicea TaxID=6063 RepID=UPI00312B311E
MMLDSRMTSCVEILLCCLLLLGLGNQDTAAASSPPVPSWPDQFSVQLTIYVEQYGNWQSIGAMYYNYTQKTFRADYIDWCLPLFDTGSPDKNNYTCTFLATQGSMYFVNHTALSWDDYQCCLFEEGLAAVPPDWMKNCQYNGTQQIWDTECDAWWFPGTSDPEKPCYGYWTAQDDQRTPVQFFGLSSVGPTILKYSGYKPGPFDVPLNLPSASCQQECKPPLSKRLRKAMGGGRKREQAWPIQWPSC